MNWLFVAFALFSTMTLSAQIITPLSTIPAPLAPEYLSYSHNGRWVSLVNLNNVAVYRANCANGDLGNGRIQNAPAGSILTSLAYAPNDSFLAATGSAFEDAGAVTLFRVDCTTGMLTEIQRLSAANGNTEVSHPFFVAYSPDGRFAAVTNQGTINAAAPPNFLNGNISIYRVNKVTGQWARIQTLFFGSDQPQAIAYAPDGKSAAATFFATNGGRSFTVDPVTGLFSNIQTFQSTGNNILGPFALAYAHEAHSGSFFAAVTNINATDPTKNTVTTYTVDPTTGLFTPVQIDEPTDSAFYVAYSRSDRVAAITSGNSPFTSNIYVYCVDQMLGAFTLQQTYSDPQLPNPVGVDFAPCSDFMTVSDQGQNVDPPSPSKIRVFLVDEQPCT